MTARAQDATFIVQVANALHQAHIGCPDGEHTVAAHTFDSENLLGNDNTVAEGLHIGLSWLAARAALPVAWTMRLWYHWNDEGAYMAYCDAWNRVNEDNFIKTLNSADEAAALRSLASTFRMPHRH